MDLKEERGERAFCFCDLSFPIRLARGNDDLGKYLYRIMLVRNPSEPVDNKALRSPASVTPYRLQTCWDSCRGLGAIEHMFVVS